MRSVKIDRKKWLNGNTNDGYSVLWCDRTQQGCCLGHAIHQTSKLPWHKLEGRLTPEEVFQRQDILGLIEKTIDIEWGHEEIDYIDSNFTEKAMKINDALGVSDKTREKRLIKLFRKNKIRLSFYD